METVYDLIEEAKVRTVCWAICVFAISYFLSHTSKSMWTNVPISLLIFSAFRYLSYQVELRWRVRPIHKQTYLSHLGKKQLSVNDSRLSTVRTTSKWRRKIDAPLVEAAINEFTDKILQDFVIDLWYSSITPDKEAPELIRTLILDALGEISGRIKEINLIDLLTRDMVDLIGNHLDLYRKNQSEIGVDVMGTLSFEERDERLKRHLMASKELHPALISQECEYKVLQRIVGGIIAIVLNPREAQSPLVRCFSRELLTSLVVQPLMNFASPAYINELIEQILLSSKDNKGDNVGSDRSNSAITSTVSKHSVAMDNLHSGEPDHKRSSTSSQSIDLTLVKSGGASLNTSGLNHPDAIGEDSTHCTQARSAEWAMVLEAATKRRSEVLAPENLENMWTKGRNYQKKSARLATAGTSSTSIKKSSGTLNSSTFGGTTGQEILININEKTAHMEAKPTVHRICGTNDNTQSSIATNTETHSSQDLLGGQSILEGHFGDGSERNASKPEKSSNEQLCQSSTTPDIDSTGTGKTDKTLYSQKFYSSNLNIYKEELSAELVPCHEESLTLPKIKCRVVGAYFEKLGSKSFAVYSIAVTDAESKTWFVKRRYRNFERLHRHLKDIPNYSLHLPPKRFLSSSIDDYFVHQRCILLDKYLQDLLSIANIAEQHEVWDFLSSSSKNYSFGKSTSVMKTLAVNVDDAMDDIVRQFKGVSDGLRRKVVGPSTSYAISPPITERMLALPWNEEANKHSPSHSNMETSHSLSDDEVRAEEHSSELINGWHSDNELHSKGFPPRIVKRNEESVSVGSQRGQQSDTFDTNAFDKHLSTKTSVASDLLGDFSGVPPEWTPANVSVPLLNLVDKTFQLNRRGWLRRQVFWISKQILQLMMEDAIDDWILMQINWLRSEVVIAQGIRWVQDILWPDGTFFIKLGTGQGKSDDTHSNQKPSQVSRRASCDKSSFELQLEAARRASDIKKMIVGGAPTALVSLIGHKQYRRSAKDIYYFLQSTICLKQLAYCMLELVLVSVFPELHDLFLDIHEKMQAKQV